MEVKEVNYEEILGVIVTEKTERVDKCAFLIKDIVRLISDDDIDYSAKDISRIKMVPGCSLDNFYQMYLPKNLLVISTKDGKVHELSMHDRTTFKKGLTVRDAHLCHVDRTVFLTEADQATMLTRLIEEND